MDPRHLFVAISTIAMATALFSPVRVPVFLVLPAVLPDFLWESLRLRIFLNTLAIAVGVVLLSGVPAALFERATGRPAGDTATMGIWCAAAGLLAFASWQVG